MNQADIDLLEESGGLNTINHGVWGEAMKLNLTDQEWVQLIDGQSEDSELPICCANISRLRDRFVSILRGGRNNDIMDFELEHLKQELKWVADGHELTPLLQKVCEQIGFNPDEAEHKPRIEAPEL